MKPFHLEAKTISDAWFQLLYKLFDNSYRQDVQAGSFEKEQYRLQYPGVSIYIEYPDQDIVPTIPQGLGIPSPTTMEYIQDYFVNYLMDPTLAENETYKYASRINEILPSKLGIYLYEKDGGLIGEPFLDSNQYLIKGDTQLERVIEMLKKTPLTNQAVIEIAKPSDIATCYGNDGKLDPPCLRLIDFKVIPVRVALKSKYLESVRCTDSVPGTQGFYDYKCEKCNDRWVGTIKLPCRTCHPELYKDDKYLIEDVELTLTVSVYFRSWDLWAGLPTNLGGIELLKQYVASECGLVNGPMYAYSSGLHIYGYVEDYARIRTMRENYNG